MLTADKARQIAKEVEKSLEIQRREHIIKEIKLLAESGKFATFNTFLLTEADIQFFTNLGFSVSRYSEYHSEDSKRLSWK